MEGKLSFDDVVSKCSYLFVEDTHKKTADAVAEELRGQIRSMGWECLEDGETAEDWIGRQESLDLSGVEESNVTYNDLEFLCDMEYMRGNRDVDWVRYSITFIGIWGQKGAFIVSH